MNTKINKCLLLFFLLVSILTNGQINSNHVYVNGYTRSDGTFVKPHYRTAPNSSNVDNFSTIGNTNPYTGKAGYIPRDNNRSYNTNYNSKKRYTNSNYTKTTSLKDYGKLNYWVYQKFKKRNKKTKRKSNYDTKKIISLSKKTKKEIRNKKELSISNFENGWYNVYIHSSIKNGKKYQNTTLLRKAFVKNGKIIKYIGNHNLVYDLYDFKKNGNKYVAKLIFPDNKIGENYFSLSFYDDNKLENTPIYEYPSVLFFYVKTSNNGGAIYVTLENENNYFGSFEIKSLWNSEPNCQSNIGVAKFYVPKGIYQFYAQNNKSFWSNKYLKVNKNCEGMRLTFN